MIKSYTNELNPFKLNLIVGTVHFHFEGCWVVFFIFLQFLKEIDFCKAPVTRSRGGTELFNFPERSEFARKP